MDLTSICFFFISDYTTIFVHFQPKRIFQIIYIYIISVNCNISSGNFLNVLLFFPITMSRLSMMENLTSNRKTKKKKSITIIKKCCNATIFKYNINKPTLMTTTNELL